MSNEIKIGGNTFTVSPLPASKSFALQARIAPAIAEVFGVIGKVRAGADIGSLDVGEMATIVDKLAGKLPPAELEALLRELLATATMDNLPLFTSQGNPFEVRMQGRTIDTWKLLWHSIQVNYPDFFSLLDGLGAAAEKPAAPSAGSTT